jgi:AraC-like DNA-binding protein
MTRPGSQAPIPPELPGGIDRTDAPGVRFWRDADLGGLELRWSRYDEACFGTHTHDTYSVGLVLGGTTRAVLRGEPASPAPGQVVLLHPDEVHSCNPVRGSGWAYRMFYLRPGWFRDLARDLSGTESGYPRFAAALVDDAELYDLLQELARTIEEEAEVLERQGAATDALSLLLERHCAVVPVPPGAEAPDAVVHARDLLERGLDQPLSLDELARECGLSRCHLLRAFKRATGLPPHAWRTQRRIQLARRLLGEGVPIAEVALATGFTDQSHFTTAFRKVVGATPGQYRHG